MRKPIALLLAAALLACLMLSCGVREERGSGSLVVATNFVLYDTARSLAGDFADVRMLLAPGAEAHEYELTLADADLISRADLFLYVGGESEDWVGDLFASMGEEDRPLSFRAADCAELREEEEIEGMQSEGVHGEEEEFDEHVWTSFGNLFAIARGASEAMKDRFPEYADRVDENLGRYEAEMEALEREYREMAESAARRTVVFADRFPFLYLAKELGLEYYAAFSGCSSNVEASLATVSFLVNKVKEEGIPSVFIIEFSDGKCAEAVAVETGCGIRTLFSGHNVSPEDFARGITYADLLRLNLEALRAALN